MPRLQKCESLSRRWRRWIQIYASCWKVAENIWSQHNHCDSSIPSVSLDKMCYCLGCFAVELYVYTFSSWHIRRRIMIEEEQRVFGLPELTSLCLIAMVTSVSVTRLLTSACLTCHKLICHLCPPPDGNLSKGLLCSLFGIPDSHTTLSPPSDNAFRWKARAEKPQLRGRVAVSEDFLQIVAWQMAGGGEAGTPGVGQSRSAEGKSVRAEVTRNAAFDLYRVLQVAVQSGSNYRSAGCIWRVISVLMSFVWFTELIQMTHCTPWKTSVCLRAKENLWPVGNTSLHSKFGRLKVHSDHLLVLCQVDRAGCSAMLSRIANRRERTVFDSKGTVNCVGNNWTAHHFSGSWQVRLPICHCAQTIKLSCNQRYHCRYEDLSR